MPFVSGCSRPAWLLCLLLWPAVLPAQSSGALAGTVSDAEDASALPGANVLLVDTGQGTTTDAEGHFAISRIPAGTHKLQIALIGYGPLVRQVEVRPGETSELKLELEVSPVYFAEMLVQADRSFSAASARSVRDFDIQVRPRSSTQELLQTAPGLIIAQHAGGGKAEQIFMRNFDADHGTDVAISVDGVPVNMVSHGHGQGYADLHFLIAELVEGLDVYKGPYFAQYGNLATAGAVSFRTRDRLEENLISLEGGRFDTGNLTLAYQIPLENPEQSAYFAGKFYRTDGPFDDPQDFRRLNFFAKLKTPLGAHSSLSLSVDGFTSAWDASGQIPARAVRSGLIGRFGSIDPFEGGTTSRRDLNLRYESRGENNTQFSAQAYFTNYDFKLFSDFTFFLNNPVDGDMIEQTDDRLLTGAKGLYSFTGNWGAAVAHTTLGGGFRSDDAGVGLWQDTARVRRQVLVDSDVLERNFYLWGQEELVFGPRLRLILGLRGDYFTFNVEDHLEGRPAAAQPHASGFAQKGILSPKINLVLSPAPAVDVFFNFGTGFHSNDARSVVISERLSELDRSFRRQGMDEERIDTELAARHFDPSQRGAENLPRAIGAEVGTRARLGRGLNLGAAFWWLDLDEELVYVGDEGTTEPRGRTRRLGLDLEGRLQLLPWLWADADLNISTGRLRDEPSSADDIPLAPDFTSTGGLSLRHPLGLEGSLRYRHLSDRPANEDNSVTARGYTVFDLQLAYRIGNYKFHLTIENLFDTRWNEAQFDTRSQLRGEAEPVSELHFTPGNPLSARTGLSYLF